jgi:ATP-binding cassette subfamily B protein
MGYGSRRAGTGGTGGSGRFARSIGAEVTPIPPERRARTVRRIAAFFGPYRPQVAIVVVAILVTSLLGLINPLLLGKLLDEVIIGRNFEQLNLYVGLMIGIPILTGLLGVGQAYLNNVVGQNVMQDLRNALYAHLQKLPLRFFTETRTGEIQSRLANDVGGVQQVVTDTAANLTSNVAVAISTIVAMVLIDWRLTALSLGVLPFFMYLTFRVGKVRREVSTETQKSLADLSAATEETLSVSGMLLSKTFGQQTAAVDRFRGLNRRLAKLQIRQAMVGRWFFMIIGTIFSITPAFVYWLAGTLAANGDPGAPSAGSIVAFTTLQSRLFFPLGALLNVQVEVQGSLALFDRIFEYLDLDPEIVDAPDAVALDPATVRGSVRLRDVSFRYPAASVPAVRLGEVEGDPGALGPDAAVALAEVESVGAGPPLTVPELRMAQPFALEGIDFEAAPGELVALVGPSGSGKTTTTYLIPRLYDVDEGAVEIDGQDVRKLTLESLGRVIGFVTQETYLFHASIRDNLRYAKPDATDAELEIAATAAAIHDRIVELPDGYDTMVGERGYKLSGGEKQRIAIARVLLKDPRILILDEATSALDTVSERLIQAALERLMEGRTTIAIAHRLSTILRADRILVYERGRIVERGTHAELLAQGGLYANLYREQFESTGPELVAT